MSFNQHIILDVDNTLIYTASAPIKKKGIIQQYDFKIEGMNGYVYIRPGLKTFLEFCFNNYKSVSIWSLGNFEYISAMLKNLRKKLKMKLPFFFIYTYENTPEIHYKDEPEPMLIKDLNKIWDNPRFKEMNITKNNTIFIDDRADVLRETPKNHIKVKEFKGEMDDRQLEKLILLLIKISDKKQITRVKKDLNKD